VSETVQDHLCNDEWGFGTSQANRFCLALGLDPDTPIETLRQRLLWGERLPDLIERMKRAEGNLAATNNGQGDATQWRLGGKQEGVALARSYAEEILRDNPNQGGT
jgi:hypothetical protein